MRLTLHSDYAMRVLSHLGAQSERLASIAEIAESYRISRNHLTKVVHGLVKAGLVDSVRGRSGGIRLARSTQEINLGDVLRLTEEGFELVDCANCVIAPACGLTAVVNEALAAFMAVFDGYTLADILGRRKELRHLLSDCAEQDA